MTDWDKGFDAYFDHVTGRGCPNPPTGAEEHARWYSGYRAAYNYRAAIKARKASPRDSEIADLEELIR